MSTKSEHRGGPVAGDKVFQHLNSREEWKLLVHIRILVYVRRRTLYGKNVAVHAYADSELCAFKSVDCQISTKLGCSPLEIA